MSSPDDTHRGMAYTRNRNTADHQRTQAVACVHRNAQSPEDERVLLAALGLEEEP